MTHIQSVLALHWHINRKASRLAIGVIGLTAVKASSIVSRHKWHVMVDELAKDDSKHVEIIVQGVRPVLPVKQHLAHQSRIGEQGVRIVGAPKNQLNSHLILKKTRVTTHFATPSRVSLFPAFLPVPSPAKPVPQWLSADSNPPLGSLILSLPE